MERNFRLGRRHYRRSRDHERRNMAMTSANEIFFVNQVERTDSPKEVLIKTEGGVKKELKKKQ